MKLIGMFDSPFVRRVAISMRMQGVPFEHVSWSIGKDQAAIAKLNPLGTVPVLVLDDGEVLVDSSAILDHVGALLPAGGDARRRMLAFVTLALGVADKARQIAMERAFRPADKRHAPLVERFRGQMEATCVALDAACADDALFGETQAAVTLGCAITYAREAGGLSLDRYPALARRFAEITARPVFREIYLPFDAPVV